MSCGFVSNLNTTANANTCVVANHVPKTSTPTDQTILQVFNNCCNTFQPAKPQNSSDSCFLTCSGFNDTRAENRFSTCFTMSVGSTNNGVGQEALSSMDWFCFPNATEKVVMTPYTSGVARRKVPTMANVMICGLAFLVVMGL